MNRLLSLSLLAALLLSTACSKDEGATPSIDPKKVALYYANRDSRKVFRYSPATGEHKALYDVTSGEILVSVEPVTQQIIIGGYDGIPSRGPVDGSASDLLDITNLTGGTLSAKSYAPAGGGRMAFLCSESGGFITHLLIVNLVTGAKDTLFSGYPSHWGLAIDTVRKIAYWGSRDKLYKAPLDKSTKPVVILSAPAINWISQIAFDYANNELIVGDNGNFKVFRVKTDGSNMRNLADAVTVGGVAYNPATKRIYFSSVGAGGKYKLFHIAENGGSIDSVGTLAMEDYITQMHFHVQK